MALQKAGNGEQVSGHPAGLSSTLYLYSPPPIRSQHPVEFDIFSSPPPTEVLPPGTFILHTGALEHSPGRRISAEVVGVHPIEAKGIKGPRDDRAGGLSAIAVVPVSYTDPISEFCLSGLIVNIHQADGAD